MTGRRVAQIAKAVSLGSQETKRYVIVGDNANLEPFIVGQQSFMSVKNVFAQPELGSGFNQLEGNELVNARTRMTGTLFVNWSTVYASTSTIQPIVFYITLIAVNEQVSDVPQFIEFPTGVANNWLQEQDINRLTWEGQTVTVLKQYKRIVNPPALSGAELDTTQRTSIVNFDVSKLLRGKKVYQLSNIAGSGSEQLKWLKGYQYYWTVIAGYGTNTPATSSVASGFDVFADHYLYFKDP